MKIEIDAEKISDVIENLKGMAESAENNAKKQEAAGNENGANFYYGRMIAYRSAKRQIEGLLV